MDSGFWKNKKVLITGHTGFKGSWLSIYLLELGATLIGFSMNPYSDKDNFVLSDLTNKMVDIRGNICDKYELDKVFNQYEPEIVFHLAAQPLVRESYERPLETYNTNVIGTLNVLECIRSSKSVKIGIMITTDKCYENKEQIWGYKETDRFGGYDPYSSSKACAEILISSYRNSYFNVKDYDKHKKAIASVRAGNVIGGGDWAKDRIIPDCMRSLEAKKSIDIRNPKAVRPWEHVLEPLSGYILLAEKLYEDPIKYSEGWNFGPEYNSFSTVWEIANKIVFRFGYGELNDVSDNNAVHEANLLFLDITKAKQILGWYPRLTIDETIDMTVEWYKKYNTEDVYTLCREQINKFLYKI
jgi:CDP-glucose 4,6-dehydratase